MPSSFCKVFFSVYATKSLLERPLFLSFCFAYKLARSPTPLCTSELTVEVMKLSPASVLALLSAVSFSGPALASPPRQATRSEVVRRSYEKQYGRLQARGSSTACNTVVDDNGNCCQSTSTITISGKACCEETVFFNEGW